MDKGVRPFWEEITLFIVMIKKIAIQCKFLRGINSHFVIFYSIFDKIASNVVYQ